jgi:hypothetical protein
MYNREEHQLHLQPEQLQSVSFVKPVSALLTILIFGVLAEWLRR